MPMIIKIMPPVNFSFARYFSLNRLPIHTPKAEKPNVIAPIRITARKMFTSRNAKVMFFYLQVGIKKTSLTHFKQISLVN